MALFYETDMLSVYNDDILDVDLDYEFADLIVTSPPYNLDIAYESYGDELPYEEYMRFTSKWLERSYGWAKPDCRMCLNIPLDTNKGGQRSFYADVVCTAKLLGWNYQSTIVWNEQNISRRTAWGSWMSASAPYVIAPVEMIALFYKDTWKKENKKNRFTDIAREQFLEWTNGVWTFNGESAKRVGHPAPFPIELPFRCIKMFSFVGDTVLDPFLGSGTTILACNRAGRRGVGVDVDLGYCELARDRLLQSGVNQLEIDMLMPQS